MKAALSHLVPDGNLESVLRICFQKTLELSARRKYGARKADRRANSTGEAPAQVKASASQPARDKSRRAPGRYIPAEVRREVWKRDGGRCTWVGPDGKRCGSRYQLEFDHLRPYALGGPPTAANLTLHCRPHNLHGARELFGAQHMAKFMRRRPELDTT